MNSKDYSVKMAFPKLSSQMEDHNSDMNSETLHKSGDSNISNPHHITINPMEKQNNLSGQLKTPSPRHIRVAKTQTVVPQINTNHSKLPSPAKLMNSRRYRTLLPTWTMLKSRKEEREELMSLKRKQEQYYNKSAQMLPELSANMKVYVQLQPHSRDWKPATVTECLEYNRYKVQLDFNGKKYIRNHIYIKPRTEEPRRSKRTIKKPRRYQDYHT